MRKRNDTTPKLLGERLLISRRDMGWNQEKLGEAAGISRGHIAKIERGEVPNPTIDVIYRLADALGVSRAYLLGLVEDPLHDVEDEDTKPHRISRQSSTNYRTLGAELLDIFGQLSTDSQQIILAMADKLRDADDPNKSPRPGEPKPSV